MVVVVSCMGFAVVLGRAPVVTMAAGAADAADARRVPEAGGSESRLRLRLGLLMMLEELLGLMVLSVFLDLGLSMEDLEGLVIIAVVQSVML